ncbi:hypothetical protein [Plesiomonas shigelloides]|uniref:hypothetical protein n=1 Tax=Plesiomonas shigelloides TaxID=703 RepID=UPI0015B521A6|nr:hypothetical protein [Plesiomonas shigelloides]
MTGLIFVVFLWVLLSLGIGVIKGYAKISLWVIIKIEKAVRQRRIKRDLPPE